MSTVYSYSSFISYAIEALEFLNYWEFAIWRICYGGTPVLVAVQGGSGRLITYPHYNTWPRFMSKFVKRSLEEIIVKRSCKEIFVKTGKTIKTIH